MNRSIYDLWIWWYNSLLNAFDIGNERISWVTIDSLLFEYYYISFIVIVDVISFEEKWYVNANSIVNEHCLENNSIFQIFIWKFTVKNLELIWAKIICEVELKR